MAVLFEIVLFQVVLLEVMLFEVVSFEVVLFEVYMNAASHDCCITVRKKASCHNSSCVNPWQ